MFLMGKILIGKDATSSKPTVNSRDSIFANSVYSRIEALENTIINVEQKNSESKESEFNLLDSLEFKQIKQNVENINKKIAIIEALSSQFKSINISLSNISSTVSDFEKNTELKNNLLLAEIKEKSENNDLNFKSVLSENSSIKVCLKSLLDDFQELNKKIKQLQLESSKDFSALSSALNSFHQDVSSQLRKLNLTQDSTIMELMSFYDRQNQLINEYNKKQKTLTIGIGLSVFISIISVIVNLL